MACWMPICTIVGITHTCDTFLALGNVHVWTALAGELDGFMDRRRDGETDGLRDQRDRRSEGRRDRLSESRRDGWSEGRRTDELFKCHEVCMYII